MSQPTDQGPFKGPAPPPQRPPLKLVDGPVKKGGLGLFLVAGVLFLVMGGFRWQEYKKASLAEDILQGQCTAFALDDDACEGWIDKVSKPCLKRFWIPGGRYRKSYLDRAGFVQCAQQRGGFTKATSAP